MPVRAPSRYYLSRVGRLDLATPGVLTADCAASSGLDQEKHNAPPPPPPPGLPPQCKR